MYPTGNNYGDQYPGYPPQQPGTNPPQPYGCPAPGSIGFNVGYDQPGSYMPGQPYGGTDQPYGGPGQPYGGPGQPYGGPGQPYGGPSQPYGGPGQPYGGPGQPYGGPGQPYGGPGQAYGDQSIRPQVSVYQSGQPHMEPTSNIYGSHSNPPPQATQQGYGCYQQPAPCYASSHSGIPNPAVVHPPIGGGITQPGQPGMANPAVGHPAVGVAVTQPGQPGMSNPAVGHPAVGVAVTQSGQYGMGSVPANVEIRIEHIGSSGEIYRGTMKPHPNFNAEQDANVLRKAMKGLGTDEKAIIECLGRRNLAQRLEIKRVFKTMFGKDLIDELKSELSGHFSVAVVASLYEKDYFDVHSLRKAMEGAGTTENVLTEILTSRSNREIINIKDLYKRTYNRDLEKDVISETSGFYKRVLVSCLQANKNELTPDQIVMLSQRGPSAIVDMNLARQEAQELYNAGEKKLGTDEACFIRIFALRNRYQLRATFDEYLKVSGRDIFSSIHREMSGDLASSLSAIAMQAISPTRYFAERLHKSMKGLGTNDHDLIRIVLTRSEIDLFDIKNEFQKEYGKTLESYVVGDISGDYKKYLMRFVEGN